MSNAPPKAVDQIVEFLDKQVARPDTAIVLGSGVQVLEHLESPRTYMYEEVFGIKPSVAGHTGSLTVGVIARSGSSIAVFRGRFHLYEGHDWNTVTLPAKLVTEWGIPNFIVTNAAGGLNKDFNIGDLMVVTGYRDHLNPELAKTGLIPALAPEAQNACNSLTESIIEKGALLSAGDKSFRPLRQGVYAALLGPSYETLAEIEMLRRLKADAVGMSTVPELLTAKNTGTTAAAISVITNVWSDNEPMGGHEEVLEASKAASRRLDQLLLALTS